MGPATAYLPGDGDGSVAAALSVSGPLTAMDLQNREARLAAVVIEAADSVSVALGYSTHRVGVTV